MTHLLDTDVNPASARPLVGVPLVSTQAVADAPPRNAPFAISRVETLQLGRGRQMPSPR